jgi:hypothetical protein
MAAIAWANQLCGASIRLFSIGNSGACSINFANDDHIQGNDSLLSLY